jgi:ferric-dicitrate binding protein FerR (iron transport regulator)
MEEEYLVKKWLSNELSEAEEQSFKALEDAYLFEEIIQEAQRFRGDEQAKVASFSALEPLLESKNKVRSINWIGTASKIAAIFVIGIAIYYFMDKNSMESFTTTLAQKELITLPDHSIVNLNQSSQLEYNAADWDENRSLKLTGEAYFDVEKGKRFNVVTDQGIVSVLGTEFNVLSRDGMFKVSCYEGLVQVSYGNQEVELPAGTEFVVTAGSSKKIAIVVAEPSWVKGLSVFENVPVADVFNELEKQYHVSVSYDSDIKLNFTGAFEHNNLENALKSITQPVNLTFKIINTKEVIITNVNKK